MFEISAFALAAVDHGSPETTRKPDKNVDAKQSLALEEAAMEKADKYAKLIKALEDAHSIADELNDEIAVALIERALRYIRTISNYKRKAQ